MYEYRVFIDYVHVAFIDRCPSADSVAAMCTQNVALHYIRNVKYYCLWL